MPPVKVPSTSKRTGTQAVINASIGDLSSKSQPASRRSVNLADRCSGDLHKGCSTTRGGGRLKSRLDTGRNGRRGKEQW